MAKGHLYAPLGWVKKKFSELNSKFEYSTDEVAIGIWADGKTLYRKCFYGITFINSTNIQKINLGLGNVNIIDIVATYKQEGNYYRRSGIPAFYLDYYKIDTGELWYMNQIAGVDSNSGTIVVVYTKN